MYIAKVIGNVVSTTKCEKLTGLKLLLVQQIDMLTMKESGTPVVISDSVGAGVGEIVMVVTGGSARLTETTTGKPVDATIVGIIDTIEIDDRMLFEKYPQRKEVPMPEERAEEKSEEKPEEELPEEKPEQEIPAEVVPDTQTIPVDQLDTPGQSETGQTETDQIEANQAQTAIHEELSEKKTEQPAFESNSQKVTNKNKPNNNYRK